MGKKYGSFCTGVSADTLAVKPLGWEAVFFSEIDNFPSAVLAYHWPDVPNLGDMTKINGDRLNGTVDVVFGGTPCQGFSIAGRREGMDDERSGLAMCFLEHISKIRPQWVVWENVPGVFSSWTGEPEDEKIERWTETSDFDQFVAGLSQRGYGCAWRVFDAQFTRVSGFEFAVPQRRRRVFVIGYLGDWRPSAAVLFDKESLSWNAPPSRSTGYRPAGGFEVGTNENNKIDNCDDVANTLQTTCGDYTRSDGFNMVSSAVRMRSGCDGGGKGALVGEELSHALKTSNDQTVFCVNNRPNDFAVETEKTHTLRASDYKSPPVVCYENHANDSRVTEMKEGIRPPLSSRAGTGGGNLPLVATAIAENIIGRKNENGGNRKGFQEEVSYTLNATGVHGVNKGATIRRLTTLECDRLMGFPDNHTRIPWSGKAAENCPDSHRYKACGNSICVNVIKWIAMRIDIVSELQEEISNAGQDARVPSFES